MAPSIFHPFPPPITPVPLPRQLPFCKLFYYFTAAFSVQPQSFYHFSLAKNRSQGPHLPPRLKFNKIIRILIHIHIRLNFHVHFLYVYIYLYISYTYFHVRFFHVHFLNSFFLPIYVYVFPLALFSFLFPFLFTYTFICSG